jgi:hypothetical protein
VVPPVARGPGGVAAAARRDHDQVAPDEQTLLSLDVDREAVGDDVVDPSLYRAWGAEIVERQAQENRVGLLDLGNEPLREIPGSGLGGGVLVAGDVPRQPPSRIEVGDWFGAQVAIGDRPLGMGRAPPVRGAGRQCAADGVVKVDARVDVQQMGQIVSPSKLVGCRPEHAAAAPQIGHGELRRARARHSCSATISGNVRMRWAFGHFGLALYVAR